MLARRSSERSTSLSPPGVKTRSAPYARVIFLRSSLMPSGITIVHGHPGLEIPARLGALEHPQVDPVLEAAARTEPLDLQIDGGTGAGRHAIELHERRASDGGGDGGQRGAICVPEDRHRDRIVPQGIVSRPSSTGTTEPPTPMSVTPRASPRRRMCTRLRRPICVPCSLTRCTAPPPVTRPCSTR